METMQTLGFSPKDLDEVKGIFSDTNIYLLAVTMLVASVHVSLLKPLILLFLDS